MRRLFFSFWCKGRGRGWRGGAIYRREECTRELASGMGIRKLRVCLFVRARGCWCGAGRGRLGMGDFFLGAIFGWFVLLVGLES